MNKNLCRKVTIANVRVYVVNVNASEYESAMERLEGRRFDILVSYTAIVLIRLY